MKWWEFRRIIRSCYNISKQFQEAKLKLKIRTGKSKMNVMMKDMIKTLDKTDLELFKLEKEVYLIVDGSVRVKCSFLTRSKALLIYHHFKRCIHDTKYDPFLVAIACLDLSAKYHEEDVPLDAIIHVFCCMIDDGPRPHDKKFHKIKKSVTTIECVIMRMLEFSLNHKLAHEYSSYFLEDLHEELSQLNVWNDISVTSTRIMCDMYLTNRCLNYKANEIAVAAIETSLYLAGIKIHDKKCTLNTWLKSLSATSKRLDIIEDIFKVCNVGPVAARLLNSDWP